MYTENYTLGVDEGYELTTSTIIDLIFKPERTSIGKAKIIIRLDSTNKNERNSNRRMLRNICHVNSVSV